ncbi:sigma-54-dependent Fis family transcriptional regulator [candidate division KSB1 bacterium]|nr:sigma-54-dependent Fis family transcriptional regulator [candidate division KSB1 bacterium]
MKDRILLVDDEPMARYGMRRALGDDSYHLAEAENGHEARFKIESWKPDLVLCDIRMPEMDGLELLRAVGGEGGPVFIMITAHGTERIAVEAMKAGAFDYLVKPYELDELRLTVENALEKLHLQRENLQLRRQLQATRQADLIGESDAIQRVRSLIDKVSQTDVTVLLTGESGTGKELAAGQIHRSSPRHKGPFVTMNCAAIPKDLVESELFGHEKGSFTGALAQRQGKFERADGGTLFLDEIADMSLETQAKILRVLEDKQITRLGGKQVIRTDVRLISATNKDLCAEIDQGRFRSDLYYRIKVVEIHLPPLRERPGDILLLAHHFLQRCVQRHNLPPRRFDASAILLLQRSSWPGNVRQLQNLIEQAVVLAEHECISAAQLPDELHAEAAGAMPVDRLGERSFAEMKNAAMENYERDLIRRALQESKGNVSAAARLLQMKRQFLQQKMQTLNMNAADFRI